MKYFLIASLLLLFSCGNKPVTIGVQTLNLKGPVKEISDLQYHAVLVSEWETSTDTSIAGLPPTLIERSFDEDGRWISSKTFMPADKLFSTTEITYDEDGNYVESTDRDTSGKPIVINKVISISPEKIEYESFDRFNKKLSSTVAEYENGLLVKQRTVWTEGGYSFETEFSRDEEGNETSMTYTNNLSGNETRDERKVKLLGFDEQGNWTKQIMYHEGEKACIVIERKITYY